MYIGEFPIFDGFYKKNRSTRVQSAPPPPLTAAQNSLNERPFWLKVVSQWTILPISQSVFYFEHHIFVLYAQIYCCLILNTRNANLYPPKSLLFWESHVCGQNRILIESMWVRCIPEISPHMRIISMKLKTDELNKNQPFMLDLLMLHSQIRTPWNFNND